MGRKVYYIPMVHTPGELGSLEGKITTVQERVFGKEKTRTFLKSIADYWELVSERIGRAGLYQTGNGSRLHVFVDSLPNGKKELVQATVQELVASGKIPAYQIIKKLQAVGAQIHGTENAALLTEEVQYWKGLIEHKRSANPEWESEHLEKRDQAIIVRINEVVPDGETAILFIGRQHNVVERLADDFEVVII